MMDNYATHKAPMIKAWLAKRPRYHVHFTPTYASWINQVERWFALLTERQIRRGVHRSVTDLETAITTFIASHNAASPGPFRWTKSPMPSSSPSLGSAREPAPSTPLLTSSSGH